MYAMGNMILDTSKWIFLNYLQPPVFSAVSEYGVGNHRQAEKLVSVWALCSWAYLFHLRWLLLPQWRGAGQPWKISVVHLTNCLGGSPCWAFTALTTKETPGFLSLSLCLPCALCISLSLSVALSFSLPPIHHSPHCIAPFFHSQNRRTKTKGALEQGNSTGHPGTQCSSRAARQGAKQRWGPSGGGGEKECVCARVCRYACVWIMRPQATQSPPVHTLSQIEDCRHGFLLSLLPFNPGRVQFNLDVALSTVNGVTLYNASIKSNAFLVLLSI